MGIFSFFSNLFSGSNGADVTSVGHSALDHSTGLDINPANGLPMMDSIMDVGGNVYGTDHNSSMDFHNSFDDSFGGGGCGGGSMFD